MFAINKLNETLKTFGACEDCVTLFESLCRCFRRLNDKLNKFVRAENSKSGRTSGRPAAAIHVQT